LFAPASLMRFGYSRSLMRFGYSRPLIYARREKQLYCTNVWLCTLTPTSTAVVLRTSVCQPTKAHDTDSVHLPTTAGGYTGGQRERFAVPKARRPRTSSIVSKASGPGSKLRRWWRGRVSRQTSLVHTRRSAARLLSTSTAASRAGSRAICGIEWRRV
jgi:hypothetical protein